MTRRSLALFLILLSAAAAVSQTKNDAAMAQRLKDLKADKEFLLVYDEAGNTSKIYGFSADFGREQNRRNQVESFRFGLAFLFAGQTLKAVPEEYLLTFQAATKRAKFADAHRLIFTVDDTPLDLGEGRYANKNEGIEYLNFKLSREQLSKLARGKNVSLKIGNADYSLSAENLKMLADLLALSEPANL